ncbi:MAG TPA: hypothetical protein VGG19_19460 [Tepidisphaeraceae bacterium]|jgi:hypothetical protein
MSSTILKRMALGAAAGLVGTVAIRMADMISKKVAPESEDPIRREPGGYFVEQMESPLSLETRLKIPDALENTVAAGMGYAYGMSFGALYAAAKGEEACAATNGVGLGLLCWAVGYLGWMPAIGIMEPIWRHRPIEIAGPIVRHAVYGLATAATYEGLEKIL